MAKLAISHVIVPILVMVELLALEVQEVQEVQDVALADTPVEGGRNATNAARSDTLLVTVPKAELVVATEVVTRAKVVMEAVTAVADVKDRLATLAADTDICLATAPKGKSATIVSLVSWLPTLIDI